MSAGAAILLPKCLENISIFFCLGLDIRVSEIVKAHIFHANRLDDALEAVIDGAV